jgi:hypothetical protein
LRFPLADRWDCTGGHHCGAGLSNRIGGRRVTQFFADELLLTGKFAANQLPSNSQSNSRLISESLSASHPSVRWANGTRRSEHGAISLKHDKGSILVSEPAKRRERDHPISPDHDETPKAMPDAGKAGFAAGCTYSILKDQVTTINAYCDPVPEEGHNSVSGCNRRLAGIAGFRELIYGLRSCHWS